MTFRTLLKPTGFIDAPFGHDGKVARLAGTMLWFSAVEFLRVGDDGRVRSELVPVEGIEARLEDDVMAASWAAITAPRAALQLGARTIRLDQPQLMAILNATPDSFSDGGKAAGLEEGFAASEAGAAILDVGGESTRPGAKTVWEGDEIERVVPLVKTLAASGAAVSIDTRKASVMEAALAAGASLVNDVSALTYDPRSAEVVARAGVPVVLMHHQGSPETMQDAPSYPRGALVDVYFWLEDAIARAVDAGIDRAKIIVDPGIGFGKSVAHNLELMNGLAAFHALGCPLLVGASRKRTIGALHNEAPADRRLGGSLALALKAVDQGAQLVRAHDVFETVQALRVWRGLKDQALTPRL
ncbi:dihydropteroate synthase [Sphingomonas astaxanthinifaciens]|uniref:dihydropteroate synthase n=1 Tax=Sphingomonas astaxanthinifaciens DSM 22298 TaxID=1123267 RepID=A0ABQ5ZBL5_9SPHN|nr:dihydropteroate synthase [Sphingomonas astaxanthinifaciens]GLR47992.1 dihydropteroate synthase [Sphingomonas astaxanthinifaciens DSM 22298]